MPWVILDKVWTRPSSFLLPKDGNEGLVARVAPDKALTFFFGDFVMKVIKKTTIMNTRDGQVGVERLRRLMMQLLSDPPMGSSAESLLLGAFIDGLPTLFFGWTLACNSAQLSFLSGYTGAT